VRIGLDTQYEALVESELLGNNGESLKTFSLVELKKVSDQWIMRTIEVRDEANRSKTRLAINAAALGRSFSSALFDPATLPEQLSAPADGEIDRF
jgi:hypothetical protein